MAEYGQEWLGHSSPLAPLPPEFIPVVEAIAKGIDRRLGYLGDRRYVLFYSEAQGQEVIWRDGASYGFGVGGWREFIRDIWPLSGVYEVSVGDDTGRGGYVLVIDRILSMAYFAPRTIADAYIDQHLG